MKQVKKILGTIPFFFLSCVSAQYIDNYEPINVFLETQKIDKNKKYILQADKEPNAIALRIFNGGEGVEHIVTQTDYTDGLFVERHWKKIYNTYVNDTIKKYWKKENFPKYDFILEKGRGLLMKSAFLDKYVNNLNYEIILISEPMYYMDQEYIMFYFNVLNFGHSQKPRTVIMKKEKDKWVVVRVIGDYIYY
ncbi:hypothetical protein [Flavobacterium sp. N502540]|uniref:hypothetical protein n=1 Tax=Flavobacterium sp. N502540 TaxID=2986838 RepID=UPI002224ED49|nr:hypothetical protein [Flavobacterium sp. N502540]